MSLISTQIDWFIDRLIDWQTSWLTDWFSNWLTDLPTVWLTDCLTNWLADWLTDWLTVWLMDWINDCLIGWLLCIVLQTRAALSTNQMQMENHLRLGSAHVPELTLSIHSFPLLLLIFVLIVYGLVGLDCHFNENDTKTICQPVTFPQS